MEEMDKLTLARAAAVTSEWTSTVVKEADEQA